MKKFDLKLTGFLVSLFIGLLLMILGNKNAYCLSFGLILIAIGLVFYALHANDKTKQDLESIDKQLDNTDDDYEIRELRKAERKIKKNLKGINVLFYVSAAFLVILSFANLMQ